MNKILQTIKNSEEKFDERFVGNPTDKKGWGKYVRPLLVKSHLHQSQTNLLNAILESLPKEEKDKATGFDWGLHTKMADIARKNAGFNKAIKQIKHLLQEAKDSL